MIPKRSFTLCAVLLPYCSSRHDPIDFVLHSLPTISRHNEMTAVDADD